jgi:AcrR family transcriptional regulator
MTNQAKRDRLIDAAAILFHRKGLTATSLADIAGKAEIPIGNVYYYFKTKEELARAALARRKEQFDVSYAQLEEAIPDPRQRLIEAVRYFENVREEYTKYGCPIGKIIDDLDVEKDTVAQSAANVLGDFVNWAERQFRHLGHSLESRKYAMSLTAGIQGAIIMAKAFQNPEIISDETGRLITWLETIPNRRVPFGKVGVRPAESNAA